MKKEYLYGIGGLILGFLLTLIIIYKMAPGLMMLENESKYGFDKTFEEIMKSTKNLNWKVPKVYDFQKSMAKDNLKVKPVKVIEFCNPKYASSILKASDERIVSSLMPCRVSIYEKANGKVYISRMNAGLISSTFGGIIASMMKKASADSDKIIKSVLK